MQRSAYDPDDPDDARGGFAEADIQAQLARVRGSAVFARAHRLSNLLAYLVEHSASGRGRDLHEANIGIELFGRGSDFDCQSDTIVRVSVRRLRDRLGDYYRGDGSADPIRFEIPKGRYRVLFHPGSRAAVTTTPPALTASPAPTTAPDPPPAPAVRSGGKRRIPRSAAALVMAGVVAVFMLALLREDGAPGGASPAGGQASGTWAAREHLALARHFYARRAPGDERLALEHYERAVAIDRTLTEAWVGVAKSVHKLWLARGELPFEEATARRFAALSTALGLDPDNAEANLRMAQLQRVLGDWDAAKRYQQAAVPHAEQDAEALAMLAGYRGLVGDFEGAIDYQRRALALEPAHAVARGNLGRYLYAAGRLEEARAALLQARQLSRGDGSVDLLLVKVLLRLDQPDAAAPLVADMPPGPRATLAGALLHFERGEEAAGRAALEALGAGETVAERLFAAQGYLATGDIDASLAVLDSNSKAIFQTLAQFMPAAVQLLEIRQSPEARLARGHPAWDRWWQAAVLPFRQAGVVAGLAGQEDDP